VPGAVLVDQPTLVVGPPMTVTYRIRPEAVWSDGTAITSKDFEYTWKQIATGKDIYDPTGYSEIGSIDTSNPKVAVVTFTQAYAPWRDLFGGSYYLLPSHLLDGKNRNKLMKDGYAFSGGPWKLDGGASGWKKGQTITLVPNDRFWGTKPSIAKVVFQFIPDSTAEFQAIKTGQVLAAYPLPQDGILDQLDQQSNLSWTISFGNSFEALFLNNQAFPLDSMAVRQAIAYATDRNAIVEQVLRPSIRQGRVLQSLVVPTFKQYFTPSFQTYSRDTAKVDAIMTADGWAKQNGVWTKGAKPAAFTISTTTGDKARSLTEQIWQSQMAQAGFKVTIKNQSANVLFGKTLFGGNYGVVLASLTGTPDPGLCLFYCSSNIPTKANDFSGLNVTRTRSAAIDAAWKAVDGELDLTKRVAAAQAGQVALAHEAASIPLYQTPSIFVWDKAKIGGKVEDNSVMGPFFTLNEWVAK
jgi:peptide/nickel transport system substrate-binding protein